jgi:rubrerythrin
MGVEQGRTLQALEVAIKMEIDGKAFYLKASDESSNELGKKLLKSLAEEEDIHRQTFEKIYRSIHNKQGWPQATDFHPDKGKHLRTVFSEAIEKSGGDIDVPSTELGAVKKAMELENKTFDYYKAQQDGASYDAERSFYESLAAEERQHYLVLLDYYEYLNDPAAYFVEKERPSLEG